MACTNEPPFKVWLQEREKQEKFLTFDKEAFDQDCDEVLKMYEKAKEPAAKNKEAFWDLLSAWQRDRDYLSTLNLHRVIAKHVRIRCQAKKCKETVESWTTLQSYGLDGLADEIAATIRAAVKDRAPSKQGMVEESAKEISLGKLDDFHCGLEDKIGYPKTNADFLELMKREHDQDEHLFPDFKGGFRTVHPRVEWNVVMRSENLNFSGVGYEPTPKIDRRQCTESLDFYMAKNRANDVRLRKAEVAALRLWTGPMHSRYAELLRDPQKVGKNGISASDYVNTLHAINSGITKLAKIWQVPANRKVYRGYQKAKMKKLEKDKSQCVGGVELSVLAASLDFDIAVQFSEKGAFILEIDVGQVNRGADVSWLSQFPHQNEILFNALSNLEFVRSPQKLFIKEHETIHVYQVAISANLKSKTLGKFFKLRKDLHSNLVEVLMQEAEREIGDSTSQSNGLIKKLGSLCIEECAKLRNEAKQTDQDVFNHGTQEYVSLVEKAIMFQKRSRAIINLVLGWFGKPRIANTSDPLKSEEAEPDTSDEAESDPSKESEADSAGKSKSYPPEEGESDPTEEGASDSSVEGESDASKADPSKFGDLLEWQLQALRLAFAKKRPTVQTMALEQDRHLESTFEAKSLSVGDVHSGEAALNVAKLLSLNPNLESLNIEVASATAELWEKVFYELCPDRANLIINGFHVAQYHITTLQQLELRNADMQVAAMVAPALRFHGPCSLTSLNLSGSPIGCAGAESLGRAFTGLQELRYVNLRQCSIADRGCTGISQHLTEISKLEVLDLSHNIVKDDGFRVLASVVTAVRTKLTSLKSIDMRSNKIQLPNVLHESHWQGVIQSDIVSKPELSPSTKVSCVVWSPSGDRIAAGCCNPNGVLGCKYEICIWDADSESGFRKALSRRGYSAKISSISWSPKGNQIVSAGDGPGTFEGDSSWMNPGNVVIWDLENETGHKSNLKGHHATVSSVAWSPEHDKIVSGGLGSGGWGSSGELMVWDARTRSRISELHGHSDAVISVVWGPDGNKFASGSLDQTIIIWNANTSVRDLTLKGHCDCVQSVAWSADGDKLASGSRDNTVIIWDAKTGEQIKTLKGHKSCVWSVNWHPQGDRIVSGCGNIYVGGDHNEIIIWNVKTGNKLSTLKGHRAGVMSVSWSPKDDQIASASNDNSIIIWDAKAEHYVSTLNGHNSWVRSVAWSPKGDLIASGSSDHSIMIWNSKTGERVSTFKEHTSSKYVVAWSPKGDKIASGSWDNIIIIWDAKTGAQERSLTGHEKCVNTLAWSPHDDNQADRIASGSDDNTIIIWDARAGKQISRLEGHTQKVMSVAWSPKGDRIVSGSYDNSLIIWGSFRTRDSKTSDTQGKLFTLKGHKGLVLSVAWSPLGDRIASGSADKTVIVWDAASGEQVWRRDVHSDAVSAVAWSPTGDRIVSGSDDKTLSIWDARTRDQVSTLKGHLQKVMSVAWSPEGHQIVSGSADHSIIVWDAKTMVQLSSLKSEPSPDGGCLPAPTKKMKVMHQSSRD